MARCYSAAMRQRHHSLPDIWLISDVRNDARLEQALDRLPRGSGLIFRHYHLDAPQRRQRFASLHRRARRRGHMAVLSGTPAEALRWGADGVYGPPDRLAQGPRLLRLATAHSLRELAQAHRARADAILLSPVFATRSHPGARTLGPVRFRLLARHATVPIIALGGMNRYRAQTLRTKKWAAIDGI